MSVFVGVFRCCKYMAKNRQFQILEGKISAKGRFFFDGGTRLGRVCVYFNLRSFVCVDVEVVCVLRPSSRLCFEESSVNSMHFSMLRSFVCVDLQLVLQAVFLLNTRPCIDFNPYLDIRPSIRPTLR